jgi:hypothetical protein
MSTITAIYRHNNVTIEVLSLKSRGSVWRERLQLSSKTHNRDVQKVYS